MKNIKKEKEVPNKNYIIVVTVFMACFVLIILGASWYKGYKDYEFNKPLIAETITEINTKEIDNYLTENTDTLIYIGDPGDKNSKKIEKKLKDFINENNLKDKMVYINLSKVGNVDTFLSDLNQKYSINKNITKYPAVIIIKNGKIVDFVSKTNYENLTIDKIDKKLKEYNY